MTTLEWAYEFRDAPDLERAGEALTRKLESFVVAGPPATARDLTDRQTFEAVVAAFIAQARRRDFAYVRIPGFVELFKTFTGQNVASEDAAAAALEASRRPAIGASPQSSLTEEGVDGLLSRIDARLERLDASLLRAETPRPSDAFSPVEDLQLSKAVARFLNSEFERRKNHKSDSTLRPILEFLVGFLSDPLLCEISREDLSRVDAALPEIPHLIGTTMALRKDLYARYLKARTAPWKGMRRNSETTLRLRYQRPLRIFFEWSVEQKFFAAPAPKFDGASDELFAVMPRDKFEDDEILRLIEAPLFTGCAGRNRAWQKGPYFYQGELYWIFLILLLSGMRTGEPPQIALDDVVRVEETLEDREVLVVHFFDMRPYDPARGRKPLKELKHLKRGDFSRVVPIHPLLIDLGLLDRVARLRAAGETRLFPGRSAYESKNGEVRWGKSISRAFDYARHRPNINLTRANLCLYSTRHLMADWLDALRTPDRVRNRVLGHVTTEKNSAGKYGGKGMLSSQQASVITELETPIIAKMRRVLMAAKERANAGILVTLDPLRSRNEPRGADP